MTELRQLEALDVFERQYVADVFGGFACGSCVHYRGVDTCEAFPYGIPLEIISGENTHRAPVEGDHGIQYEAKRGYAEQEKVQPIGEPLEPWGDEDVPITPEDIAKAIRDWDQTMPEEARGLLTARTLSPEEESWLEPPDDAELA